VTPSPLDRDAVQRKLRLMAELLDDLGRVAPVDEQRLLGDRLLRYAVERILMQLVDLAVTVNAQVVVARGGAAPRTYRESFAALAAAGVLDDELAARLAPSVGLRNVLAHEYTEVDLRAVLAAVPRALVDYRAYVGAVARALEA
jgi:uncharacterized protein YutE (UPF0331/DUF86 family)